MKERDVEIFPKTICTHSKWANKQTLKTELRKLRAVKNKAPG